MNSLTEKPAGNHPEPADKAPRERIANEFAIAAQTIASVVARGTATPADAKRLVLAASSSHWAAEILGALTSTLPPTIAPALRIAAAVLEDMVEKRGDAQAQIARLVRAGQHIETARAEWRGC